MYKSYKKWKANGEIRWAGRPPIIGAAELTAAAEDTVNRRSHNSSAILLTHTKKAIATRNMLLAEKNGLDPTSIDCGAPTRAAKISTVVAAMLGNKLSLLTKKLQVKTASRYRSEHSVMCGYSYAMTALMTHYFDGPSPPWMKGKALAVENLASSTRTTVEMVKNALQAENVYPANPNLVFSTDDTTLFVFEGTPPAKGGEEEWEWKLVDNTSGNTSVRSDFEVGSEAEQGGGLRVRLTFTFTASGLAAPPYVAVSGLTEDELSPELCPDGILAEKVANPCKGGDDLFNNGYGWLVFLRSDKKSSANNGDPKLSIGNKKSWTTTATCYCHALPQSGRNLD